MSYIPQEDIPTTFTHGHHTGYLKEILGENMVVVDWGPHTQCMCSGRPAPILFKRDDGFWYGAKTRVYWGDPDSDQPSKIWYEPVSLQVKTT